MLWFGEFQSFNSLPPSPSLSLSMCVYVLLESGQGRVETESIELIRTTVILLVSDLSLCTLVKISAVRPPIMTGFI